jgi:hypothetical protein
MKRFMNFVNSNIAKEAGRLHGLKEKIWGRRYRLVPVTDEPEARPRPGSSGVVGRRSLAARSDGRTDQNSGVEG